MEEGRSPRGGFLGRGGSLALAPLVVSLLAFSLPGERRSGDLRPPEPLDALEVRAAYLVRGVSLVERYYEERVAPVERILARYHGSTDHVRRLSLSLVGEAAVVGLDPRVLASVLLVENPWLDEEAVSPMGAIGLMQVMPFHAGLWGCPSSDLRDVEANICHGARIFARYLTQYGGNLDRALLAYNGCRPAAEAQPCHLYPDQVYARAGRLAMRRWLELY